MIVVFLIFLVIFTIPLLFPWYYLGELMISFLPYIVWIILLFIVASIFLYTKALLSKLHRFRRYIRGGICLLLCILFVLYSHKIISFYTFFPQQQLVHTWWLHILYANIHKDNTNYTDIEHIITTHDPDVLMFVEFAHHHYIHLQDILTKTYPYTNNTTWSKTFIWNMVFSKYPINNRADDFPQWSWRYGYFSLPYQNQNIYFYLLHTSSPDNNNHFVMRNNQLENFVKDFTNHETQQKHDHIIVVWDFNITPWSLYYPILSTAFSGKINNIATQRPLFFTRQFWWLPLFYAHIDHLWTSPSFAISPFKTITIPWSDHKWFLFTVRYTQEK